MAVAGTVARAVPAFTLTLSDTAAAVAAPDADADAVAIAGAVEIKVWVTAKAATSGAATLAQRRRRKSDRTHGRINLRMLFLVGSAATRFLPHRLEDRRAAAGPSSRHRTLTLRRATT